MERTISLWSVRPRRGVIGRFGHVFYLVVLLCTVATAQSASQPSETPSAESSQREAYPPQSSLSEAGAIGRTLYQRQCAKCHELGTLPLLNRSILKHMSAEYIVQTLTTGMMRKQGAALHAGEREAIAEYLTGKSVIKAGAIPSAEGRCSTDAPDSLQGASWNGWGVDLQNRRFQPAADAGLTADQVPKLKLKWAFGYPGLFAAYSQPVIKAGRVFVGGPLGQVYALDARTGCTYWTFQALGGVRGAVTVGPEGNVYFGDTRAYVYAVNGKTGKLIWKRQVDEHPLARVTSSVKLYNGRLYFGISSREEWLSASLEYECCTFRGSVVSLNAKTGQTMWKTFMISNPPKPTRKNSLGTQLYGPSGTGVWGSPAMDEKKQLLYVGTGDDYSEPATDHSDSIVALNLQDGAMVWSRQITKDDAFNGGCLQEDKSTCPQKPGPDFDFGASTILLELPNHPRLLLAGQKSGVVYALDPDNRGELVWQTKIGGGGVLGGIQWGMASDSERLFAAISDIGLRSGAEGFEPDPKLGGGLHAVSITDGKALWDVLPSAEGCKTTRCSPAQSAAVTAIPGIVFSGSEDGHIRAYSAADGKVVWDYDTVRSFETVNKIEARGGTMDGGGPAVAGGMLFVNSGYGFLYGAPGNVLLAFGVD